MADRDELKACPFCGNKPHAHKGAEGYSVQCQTKGCAASHMYVPLHAWNNRAPIQPVATQEDAGKVPVAQMSGDFDIWHSKHYGFEPNHRDSSVIDRLTIWNAAIASHPSNAATQDAPVDSVTMHKQRWLADRGFRQVGVVMMDQSGKRAIIDMGKVTWQESPVSKEPLNYSNALRDADPPAATVPQVAQSVPDAHSDDSDKYINELVQQHGYSHPIAIAARLEQWISRHGGQDAGTLTMYEAMKALRSIQLVANPPALAAPCVPSDEQICTALRAQGFHTHSLGYAETGPLMIKGVEKIIRAFRALLTTASNAGEAAQGDK